MEVIGLVIKFFRGFQASLVVKYRRRGNLWISTSILSLIHHYRSMCYIFWHHLKIICQRIKLRLFSFFLPLVFRYERITFPINWSLLLLALFNFLPWWLWFFVDLRQLQLVLIVVSVLDRRVMHLELSLSYYHVWELTFVPAKLVYTKWLRSLMAFVFLLIYVYLMSLRTRIFWHLQWLVVIFVVNLSFLMKFVFKVKGFYV